MTNLNLHDLVIVKDDGVQPLDDFSIKAVSPYFDTVEVLFNNHEKRLLEIIKKYRKGAIFGCIAWLTSTPILKAFASSDNVQIVVQKEDFLRPDLGVHNVDQWKKGLSGLYNNITCSFERHEMKEPISSLSWLSDPTVHGIRCVGNHNYDKRPAFPRAHHKFLVFCDVDTNRNYMPTALWTGSFNLTFNATQSFENVLYLTDKSGTNEILNAYLNEHHQVFALSEQLNWDSNWVTPEYRIGT